MTGAAKERFGRVLRVALLGLAIAGGAPPARAVEPDEILSDAKLEARARALSAGLRCLVCQNQSIDESDAPLARDLRLLVRERLTSGDTDEEVRAFVVARYGEFVLLKPPLTARTILLWLAPLLLLLAAVAGVARAALRMEGRKGGPAALTAEEDAKLSKHLAAGGRDQS